MIDETVIVCDQRQVYYNSKLAGATLLLSHFHFLW